MKMQPENEVDHRLPKTARNDHSPHQMESAEQYGRSPARLVDPDHLPPVALQTDYLDHHCLCSELSCLREIVRAAVIDLP